MSAQDPTIQATGSSGLGLARGEAAIPVGRTLSLMLGVALVLGLSALLAARQIPLTNDDANYIAYFSNRDAFEAPTLWRWILEEPLWRVGSSALGSVLGPFTAYRVVIFLSVLGFFFAGHRLGAPLILLAFFFILNQQLATYLYMLAIRQGVATTIFLILLSTPLGPLGACLIAALVHSTFLLLLPGALIAQLITARRFRWAGVVAAGMASLLAAMMANGSLDGVLNSIDLGRRGLMYSRTSMLNVNFFILSSVQYGLVLWLARDGKDKFFVITACMMAATMVVVGSNGVFARSSLSLDAILVIYLSKKYLHRPARLAMFVFVLALLFGHYSTSKNALSTNASWSSRWYLLVQGVL